MRPYFRSEHMLHPKSASQIQYSQRPELFPYLYSFKFNQIASIVCFIIPCHPSKIDNSSGLFQIHHSKKSLPLFSPHPLFRQLLLPQFRLHQHLFERALLHFRQFVPLDFPFRHEHGYRSVNPDFIIGGHSALSVREQCPLPESAAERTSRFLQVAGFPRFFQRTCPAGSAGSGAGRF